MKTLLAVAAGILVLAVATPGKAADLLLPAKEPPLGQGFTWTGFYIGANFGEAWGSVDYSGTNTLGGVPVATYAGNFNASGFFGGGQFGFNYQFPNNLVLGFESDYDYSGFQGSTTSCTAAGCSSGTFNLDNFGSIRGRVGYAVNNLLLFGTGGGAWGFGRSSATITSSTVAPSLVGSAGSDTSEPLGWAAGGGVEWAFLPNFTLKAEYLHLQYNGIQQTYNFGLVGAGGVPFVGTASANAGVNTVRVGVNWLFNLGSQLR
jgi:outer membrane immunogenic protein